MPAWGADERATVRAAAGVSLPGGADRRGPLRRAALYDRLAASGAQVWMTGTEPAPFMDLPAPAAFWQVVDGRVERG